MGMPYVETAFALHTSVCEPASARIARFLRNLVQEVFTKCCAASVCFVKTGSDIEVSTGPPTPTYHTARQTRVFECEFLASHYSESHIALRDA